MSVREREFIADRIYFITYTNSYHINIDIYLQKKTKINY